MRFRVALHSTYQLLVNQTGLLVPAVVVTLTERVFGASPAGMFRVAVIVAAFTTTTLVAVMSPPSTFTIEPGARFAPVKVIFTEVPAFPVLGVMDESVGSAEV